MTAPKPTEAQRKFMSLVQKAEPRDFTFPLPGRVREAGAGHRVAEVCVSRGWIERVGYTRARLTDAGRAALRGDS